MIAKMGIQVRNPKFLSFLLESGVEFACLDNKTCNKVTVPRLMAAAVELSEQISQRTRRALREAVKRKGIKLGSARPGHWEGAEHLRGDINQCTAAASKMRRISVRQAYEYLLPDLKRLRLEGRTEDEIATWLNNNGHLTTAGRPFTQVAVHRLLKRYLGDKFLGQVKDRGGHPLVIRAMEETA